MCLDSIESKKNYSKMSTLFLFIAVVLHSCFSIQCDQIAIDQNDSANAFTRSKRDVALTFPGKNQFGKCIDIL